MTTVDLERQLGAYVDYLRDMGVYDLFHRGDPTVLLPEVLLEKSSEPAQSGVTDMSPVPARFADPVQHVAAASSPDLTELSSDFRSPMAKPPSLDTLVPLPAHTIPAGDRLAALESIRAEIGDCTRCPLAYAGRKTIVFGDGDPNARLMFVGEGPGADEDASGLPFVGKAGQLLNNMIAAMGLEARRGLHRKHREVPSTGK